MDKIGFKVKLLRESKNMSQFQLANQLEVSQATISKLESGQIDKVDFLLMHKICELFEVDFKYFIEKEQNNYVNIISGNFIGNNFAIVKNINETKRKD